MMALARDRHRGGFTLLELMIIVALIGLLSVLALPAFIQVRKQSQGKRIVSDARVVDGAMVVEGEQVAEESEEVVHA